MAQCQPKTFITGINSTITEEKIHWKIRNLVDVLSNCALVNAQSIEFETGSSSKYPLNWQMGLRYRHPSSACVVFIKLLEENSENLDVDVEVSLSMVKNDGSEWPLETPQLVMQQQCEITWDNFLVFNQPESNWNRYIDTEKTSTFRVTFKTKYRTRLANESSTTKNIERLKQVFVSKLQNNFCKLLIDASCSDIKIITNDEKVFPTHRVVLKPQCAVFESMLSSESQFSESREGVIRVEDVSGKTMEIILRYLYTGELLPCWRDEDTVCEFTYAAGKYQLLEVLELLDELIGSDEDADTTCSLSLLSLVTKLELKKAESRLVQRIIKRTNSAKSGADIFNVYQSNN